MKPALLLFIYLVHTCSFCLLSWSARANYDSYLTSKTQQPKKDKKKPYSYFIVKHVPLKIKAAAEQKTQVFATLAEIPKAQYCEVSIVNPTVYCLPDDAYKRYRAFCVFLI